MSGVFAQYDPAVIRSELSAKNFELLRHLSIKDAVDSTNLILQALPPGEQHGHVVVADAQSAGRGRRGRNWHSPAGRNIYLSMAWKFQCGPAVLAQLPLAVAVCIARAVQRTGVASPGIKWPNDILVDGKKLAGSLVELSSAGAQSTLAVIGIGVNIRMSASEVECGAIDQAWTDVSSLTDNHSDEQLRDRACGILLDELMSGLRNFAFKGFHSFRNDWVKWDLLLGSEVVVSGSDSTYTGLSMGINDRGGLLVATWSSSGEMIVEEVIAADVSIRAA